MARRKRILIFNPDSWGYGCARGLINLIESIHDQGKCLVVVAARGPLISQLQNRDIPCRIFPLPIMSKSCNPLVFLQFIGLNLLNLVYFTFFVLKNNIDILYTNSALIIFPLLIAKITGKVHVWHLREFFASAQINKVLGLMARIPSQIIFCMSRNILLNYSLTAITSARVVYEYVLGDQFAHGNKTKIVEEFHFSPDAAVCVLIARIHPSKGQLEFLRTMIDIIRNNNLVLLIVGDITLRFRRHRRYKEAICDYIKAQNIANKVFLCGYRDDLADIYAAADICLFPYMRNEPFGLSLLEAYILGKRVLYYPNPGAEEISAFFPGQGGILSPETFEAQVNLSYSDRVSDNMFRIPEEFSKENYRSSILSSLNL